MAIEERDGGWRFTVVIDTRVVFFGPFHTRDEAEDVRRWVIESPDDWQKLGGKVHGLSD